MKTIDRAQQYITLYKFYVKYPWLLYYGNNNKVIVLCDIGIAKLFMTDIGCDIGSEAKK